MLSLKKLSEMRNVSIMILLNILYILQLITNYVVYPIVIAAVILLLLLKSRNPKIVWGIFTIFVYAIHFEKWNRAYNKGFIIYACGNKHIEKENDVYDYDFNTSSMHKNCAFEFDEANIGDKKNAYSLIDNKDQSRNYIKESQLINQNKIESRAPKLCNYEDIKNPQILNNYPMAAAEAAENLFVADERTNARYSLKNNNTFDCYKRKQFVETTDVSSDITINHCTNCEAETNVLINQNFNGETKINLEHNTEEKIKPHNYDEKIKDKQALCQCRVKTSDESANCSNYQISANGIVEDLKTESSTEGNSFICQPKNYETNIDFLKEKNIPEKEDTESEGQTMLKATMHNSRCISKDRKVQKKIVAHLKMEDNVDSKSNECNDSNLNPETDSIKQNDITTVSKSPPDIVYRYFNAYSTDDYVRFCIRNYNENKKLKKEAAKDSEACNTGLEKVVFKFKSHLKETKILNGITYTVFYYFFNKDLRDNIQYYDQDNEVFDYELEDDQGKFNFVIDGKTAIIGREDVYRFRELIIFVGSFHMKDWCGKLLYLDYLACEHWKWRSPHINAARYDFEKYPRPAPNFTINCLIFENKKNKVSL